MADSSSSPGMTIRRRRRITLSKLRRGAGAWTLPITLPAGSNSYLVTDGPFGMPQAGLQYRFSVRALIFAGGASSRGTSPTVTALA